MLQPFHFHDRVYGESVIDEPIILELIDSPTLVRLKEIDQAGYGEPFFPGTSYSRFEHSVGVYLLLKRYHASLEEQIAGLIHDVSHSAFSHCIDYVLDVGSQTKQDHQDNVFESFVKRSDIPSILYRYGIDLHYILNDALFPLKERDLPDLCADRIDYSLRSATAAGEICDGSVFLNALTAVDGLWIFTDAQHAQAYANLFQSINRKYYSDLPSAVMFQTVAEYLRHALEKEYICADDLYTTDTLVLHKIAAHHAQDARLRMLFERMNNNIEVKNDPENFDAHVFCKSRVVDPLFRNGNGIQRVSERNPDWKHVLVVESKPKEYFLKFARAS